LLTLLFRLTDRFSELFHGIDTRDVERLFRHVNSTMREWLATVVRDGPARRWEIENWPLACCTMVAADIVPNVIFAKPLASPT